MSSNEVFIIFTIENFEESHSKITDYLGIEPSKYWSKGDLKTNKGIIKYKSNGWELTLKKENVLHIDIQLEEMVNILFSKKNLLIDLENCTKKISIVVYSKGMMPSFVYNHKMISFLSDTSIELEQDIYCL